MIEKKKEIYEKEISDLKKELQLLKEQCLECKYRKLFSEIRVAVYESSREGKILDINPYGVKMLGYNSKAEILEKEIGLDLYFDPEDRKKFVERVERIGFVKNFEIAIRRRDGKKIVVSETSFVNKDSQGKPVSYFGILKDITESKDVEDQLKDYVEKLAVLNRKLVKSETELKIINASKDKFFSIIAHDLRAPFTSLLGLTDFMVDDVDNLDRDEIKVFSQKINMASKGIFNLVENLLEWARFQTGKIEYNPFAFEIQDVVSQIINTMIGISVKKKIEFINSIDNMLNVFADMNMINSVVQNLISNAVKFTQQGGTVEISAVKEGAYVKVSVRDNGVGISDEDKNKLFKIDEHHTTKGTGDEKGTGLGLILCKELVEKNGGKIWVESSVGKGSTFYFTVPAQRVIKEQAEL